VKIKDLLNFVRIYDIIERIIYAIIFPQLYQQIKEGEITEILNDFSDLFSSPPYGSGWEYDSWQLNVFRTYTDQPSKPEIIMAKP